MVLVIFISSLSVYGQKESAIWYFGKHAGLDFREHFPLPLTDGQTNSPEGVASVSDSLGNLLFYSDGMTIWNRYHGIMASGLSADSASTQAVTILPGRTNPNKYFVFITKSISSPDEDNYGGNYYIVDFTNNTLGEVIYDYSDDTGFEGILKNSTEKFAAIPFLHKVNDTLSIPSYRILMHQYNNNVFSIFNLDDSVYHISDQAIGAVHKDSANDDGSHGGASGQMKISMQGDKIAVALEGERRFGVYTFDKETGVITDSIFLPAGDTHGKTKFTRMAYGVEFSPSGRFLYGTSKDGGWIYQWDLSIVADAQLRATVRFIRSNPEINCGALQIAPNGKIYVAIKGQDYLGVINSPNNLDCDYVEFGARLLDNESNKGGISELGLPAGVPTGVKPEKFYFNHTCLGEVTSFYLTNPREFGNSPFQFVIYDAENAQVGYVGRRWDNDLEAYVNEYVFAEPGDYKVVLQGLKNNVLVSYTRKLTIYAPPISKWPQDTVICAGQTLDLDAGNGAFYFWVEAAARDRHLLVDSLGNNPMTGTEYSAKMFRVFVTHYNGCLTMDSIYVVRRQPPRLSYETTEAKCAESNGTATVIPNGAIENYSYSWEDFPEETSNKITNVAGGVYRVFVSSNQTGCETSIDINVEAQGTVRIVSSVDSDSLLCPRTEITLTAQNADFIDWIIPEGFFGSQVKVSPDVTTTYRVKGVSISVSDTCITEAEITIVVAPINIPELGDDLSGCVGDTIWINSPEGYIDWNWSNGMTGSSVQLTESINPLILYAKDTNYCTFSDEIGIQFYPMPEMGITSEKALCGKLNGSAAVVPEGNPDDYTFEWEDFPDNNSNKIFDVGAGLYRVLVSSLLTGCDTIVEIVVQEFGGPDTEIIASADGPVCPGTPITLTAKNADYYIWVNPEGSMEEQIIVEPYVESTYTVMGVTQDEEGNECRGYAEITIPVLPYNKPDVGPDLSACEGDTLTLEAEDSYEDWSWSNGLSGRTIQITESAPELILTAIDLNQCAVTDTLGITFHPYPEVFLGEDQTLCTNEPVLLQGGSGENYLWSTGETRPEISVLEKGLYWLEISTAGCAYRDSMYIQLVNPDSIRIDSVIVKDISCFGEVDGEIKIFAQGTGDTYTYSINGGLEYFDNGGSFENLTAGDYYRVRVLEDSVCARNYDLPLIISEPTEIITKYQLGSPSCVSCLDGHISLTLLKGGSPPFSILWDNFETGTNRKDIGIGSYSVTITDSRECFTYLPFELDMSYNIPNAFTPNGDGVNDLWTIGIIEYHPEAVVQIFDSKGHMVFESPRGYPDPWDGKYQGEYLSMGTYYYLIRLNDQDQPLTGFITLLR